MQVSIAQLNSTPGEVAANMQHLEEWAQRAAASGSAALIFPELFDTGYDMASVAAHAAAWPGYAFDALQETAAAQRIWLLGGLSEKTADGIYNTFVVFDPQGNRQAAYRKTHLFSPSGETRVFTPGSALCTLPIEDFHCGLMICYDLRFPEMSRSLVVDHGADLLVNASAWPAARPSHWRHLLRARAIENQAYVLAANRVGSDAGVPFAGLSAAIDPYGETLAEAPTGEEALLQVSIDPTAVQAARESLPVRLDRRTDLY